MKLESKIVHIGVRTDERTGAISTPIYQTASFQHPALGKSTGFDYTRTHNLTRKVLEDGVAALESGAAGFADYTYSSATWKTECFAMLLKWLNSNRQNKLRPVHLFCSAARLLACTAAK